MSRPEAKNRARCEVACHDQIVAVNATGGKKAEYVQCRVFLDASVDGCGKHGIADKRAISDIFVDASQILIHHSAGA